MRGWVFRWLLNILAIILTAVLLPGFEPTLWGIIIGSIFLGIINAVIRPILILLTLPLNILSLGLFTLIINGFMLWLTSVTIVGFNIKGFGWAVVSSIVLTIISSVISFLVEDKWFYFR